MTTRSRNQPPGRICAHQDCDQRTPRRGYPLCSQHHAEAKSGEIKKCANCSNYKPSQFPLCAACNAGQARGANIRTAQSRLNAGAAPPARDKYTPESSPKWEAGDANATEFYVYILRLTGGKFYVGQSRELLERLSEHLDGKEPATRGHNPRLVWFTELPSRDEATRLEAELKEIRDRNEREIRRMIVRFQAAVGKLDFTEG